MTDEQLHTPFTLPWRAKGIIEDLVEIFSEHEETHAKEILEIVEKARKPELREFFFYLLTNINLHCIFTV